MSKHANRKLHVAGAAILGIVVSLTVSAPVNQPELRDAEPVSLAVTTSVAERGAESVTFTRPPDDLITTTQSFAPVTAGTVARGVRLVDLIGCSAILRAPSWAMLGPAVES